MNQVKVDYWYNKAIEKYQLKAEIDDEIILGVSNDSVEEGIERLNAFYPSVEFIKGDKRVK